MSDARSWEDLKRELEERERLADEGGGAARQGRQRRLDRLTARERIAALVDDGSFVELGRHVEHDRAAANPLLAANKVAGDGVVTGLAQVDGRPVGIIAHDPTVLRGMVGLAASRKMTRLMDLVEARRAPLLTIADSEGARVAEAVDAIDAFGEVMRRIVRLRRHVLQITFVPGLCVGGAAYGATLNDWVAMVKDRSFMFITGAKVTRVVTGEEASIEDLGGADMHARVTGACHAVVPDEHAGIAWIKRLLSFASEATPSTDPVHRPTPELEQLVPTDPRRTYDMRGVVRAIADVDSTLELSEAFGKSLLTILGRIGGKRVAFVASQPKAAAGCLDVDASRKGAHFVAWAGKMGIPIVTLVDVPGYLPGLKEERGGILPFGALLLVAYGEAPVPHVCLVVRKCFGGASVLSFSADVRLALPTARIGPMGADASLEVMFPPLSPSATEDERHAHDARRSAWLAENDHGWAAAQQGYVDRVITPSDARRSIAAALDATSRAMA